MIFIYINTYKLSVEFPDFLRENYNKNKYMILDIETTGLSPRFTEVILVGIIYFKSDQWYLTQIFCDHRVEEKDLLLELKSFINDHLIITYNGHAFDIPYLNARYRAHRIDFELSMAKHFDLYRVVRASKKALNLPNYKLKTIEEFLDIHREDQISGKDSVLLYEEYEEHPNVRLRDIILLHNSDDIEYMIPTFKILDYIPNEIISKYYPFIFTANGSELICTNYLVEKDYVSASFRITESSLDMADYQNGYIFEIRNDELKIQLPVFHIGDRQFVDIDVLTFLDMSFNDLTYDDQIQFEITTKKETLESFIQIYQKHHF